MGERERFVSSLLLWVWCLCTPPFLLALPVYNLSSSLHHFSLGSCLLTYLHTSNYTQRTVFILLNWRMCTLSQLQSSLPACLSACPDILIIVKLYFTCLPACIHVIHLKGFFSSVVRMYMCTLPPHYPHTLHLLFSQFLQT